jgi:hypothetical protein
MSNKKLIEAFYSVVKYGRAPEEGVQEWIRAGQKYQQDNEVQNLEENPNHPDHYFADYLEDHGDPRHVLVRGDLKVRSSPGTYWYNKEDAAASEVLGDRVYRNIGERDQHIWGENIDVSKIRNTSRTKHIYRVHWSPDKLNHLSYVAFLHPHEFEQFLSDLGKPELFKHFK